MGKEHADAVFEGGGVKGIGLVGALSVAEEYYDWEYVAGTSAGSIVAALIAAGYTAKEIEGIVRGLDYKKFKDEGFLDNIPFIGKILSLGFEKGIYEGDYLENWIKNLLKKKGKDKFGKFRINNVKDERYRYKLRIIVSDISSKRLLVLPQDIKYFGIEPDNLSVSEAVRMSISIPFFFEPTKQYFYNGEGKIENKYNYIVDGGILSNFPVWLFDTDGVPKRPTIGFRFVDKSENKEIKNDIKNSFDMIGALFTTMMEAHDSYYISEHDTVRSISINTGGVKSTDFNLSKEGANFLFENGKTAARNFFEKWNFENYKNKYRKNLQPLSGMVNVP